MNINDRELNNKKKIYYLILIDININNMIYLNKLLILK